MPSRPMRAAVPGVWAVVWGWDTQAPAAARATCSSARCTGSDGVVPVVIAVTHHADRPERGGSRGDSHQLRNGQSCLRHRTP